MKERVGKKRSTVGFHRNADCLLKNKSNKHNKYVENQNLEHLDDISSRCMSIMRFLINNVLVELGGHIVNKSSAFP